MRQGLNSHPVFRNRLNLCSNDEQQHDLRIVSHSRQARRAGAGTQPRFSIGVLHLVWCQSYNRHEVAPAALTRDCRLASRVGRAAAVLPT